MKRVGLMLLALLTSASAARAQVVVEYYHVDAVGSVRAVTNASGATVRSHGYTPFGHGDGTSPGSATPRFSGKERDPESGFDYFGARYYASRTGRMMTVDPLLDTGAALFDPQQWNRYAYARNNPLVYVDPSGAAIELVGDANERRQGLEAICSAVGDLACSYLYENAVQTKNGTRYYVGIRTNGPSGAGPAFGAINSVSQMFGEMIGDPRVAQMTIVPAGEMLFGRYKIGKAPSLNAAISNVATSQVFLMDKKYGSLGVLPGEYMANGLQSDFTSGMVVAHEFAHVQHAWKNGTLMQDDSSNEYALRVENAVRTMKDPGAAHRKYHNFPGYKGS